MLRSILNMRLCDQSHLPFLIKVLVSKRKMLNVKESYFTISKSYLFLLSQMN